MLVRSVGRVLLVVCLLAAAAVTPGVLVAASETSATDAAAELAPKADAYVTPGLATNNFGSTHKLFADAAAVAESYLKFDTSAWYGQAVRAVRLRLTTTDVAGAGLAVFRIGRNWSETAVSWDTRPAPGRLLTTATAALPTGVVELDLSAAYPTGSVDAARLSLRIASSNPNGVSFSSREGAAPPRLLIEPAEGSVGTDPTATPRPSATATPRPTATATPRPTATATPRPSATATPTPTPSPSDALYYFSGHGTDHGVGMSQYGAKGRASDGQTYDQILRHYYTDTNVATVDQRTVVRVQLAASYKPTSSAPARISARGGTWSSSAFRDGSGATIVFPADSSASLASTLVGWRATVRDSAGTVLAEAATEDFVMVPAGDATRFEMTWRDKLPKYTLYRGSFRLRVNDGGVQAVNIVRIDDYVRGVVPAEMPPLWPIEAVKAQAVAARSYGFVRLRMDRVYDVLPTATHQVYGGIKLEHLRSNRAVDETAGQVLKYGNTVVNAFFFTVGGGHTENNENIWVSGTGKVTAAPIGYLRGVPDYDANGIAYDARAPGYAWQTETFTWAELEQMLSRDSRTKVGRLLELRYQRGVSGRVIRVTVVGSERTAYVSGPAFKSIYNSRRLAGAAFKSSMFYLERAP